jgi:hypothetical protein
LRALISKGCDISLSPFAGIGLRGRFR